MTTILIGGYYGAGNLGDEAILECMLKDLRNLMEDINFYVISWNPLQTSKEYKVNSIHWQNIPGLLDACQESNLIILGGGGLFQDYWGIDPATYLRSNYKDITRYGSLPLIANLLGIPCMIYAVGIGPFNSTEALQHTYYAFENSQLSTLRDSDSLKLLQKNGYFTDNSLPIPKVLADPVFTLLTTKDDDRIVEKILRDNQLNNFDNLIAVVLRHWDPDGAGSEWLNCVATGLNIFLSKNNTFQVILLSFQNNELSIITNDRAINEKFLTLNNQNKYHKLDYQLTPRLAQALIKKCDLVLGMRLHSLIMGINAGTPIVGIPYDPKINSLMTNAGLEPYCGNGFPPDSTDIAEKLDLACENRNEIINIMKRFQKSSFYAAKENSEIALKLISKRSRIPQNFSSQYLIEQIKLINQLDNSLEISRRENSLLISQLESKQIELDKSTKDKETIHFDLEKNKIKLDHALKENQTLISENKLREGELKKVLSERDKEISELRTNLDKIYRSRFWKLASFYYSWMEKFKSGFVPKFREIKTQQEHLIYLNEIVSEINTRSIKGFFILTSTLPFDEILNQRVMNLSKFLSKNGYGVLFVTWRWTPSNNLIGNKIEVYKNVFELPVDLFVNDLISLKDIKQQNKYFIVEFPHPDLYFAAVKLRKFDFLLIYDIIDDWEYFHAADQAIWFDADIENSLILNANKLTAVSPTLKEKFSYIRQDINLIPNGYDPCLLGKKNLNISKVDLSLEEIIIGYFGHLTDSWFDWDFLFNVLDLAEENKLNIKFHLIGYGEPKLYFLNNFKNRIIFHGLVAPSELYHHARNWDIAMIPFKIGKLAEAVDPIKLYEYLFFGLPVIVRGIPHLVNHPFVRLVNTELQFIEAIGMMRKLKQNRNDNKDLSRIILETTWENRFEQLLKVMGTDSWMFL